ncbi:eL24 family ribosomal protein [Mesoterricola silvestris]|uniref:Uncharacterized protein n=1 Tax=Mesoterricola silvestris TaxID=2927979 RepID=A0AA48GRX0_9BACT|nr:hypothetical protein [Mesoterricola silvestris]BDU73110.1 hypothetical protein METEAL_22840 [Mesoterricola silvestris]
MLISALFLLASATSPVPATPTETPAVVEPSPSATCPVCGKTIEPGQGTKVSIRGREYTVDDTACSNQLMADPDKYLESDGTPKNARK